MYESINTWNLLWNFDKQKHKRTHFDQRDKKIKKHEHSKNNYSKEVPNKNISNSKNKNKNNNTNSIAGSKFRILNELMYRQTSEDLVKYLKTRPDDFKTVN